MSYETIRANVGPLFIPTPEGPIRWRPTGPLYRVFVDDRRLNPPGSGESFSARIFVGLNVGDRAAWTIDDVIEASKRRWKLTKWTDKEKFSGASFLNQRGFFDSPEGFVSEDSVQIVILTSGSERQFSRFLSAMHAFASALAKDLEQQAVLVELQINGTTKDVSYVSDVRPSGKPAKRSKRRK